MATCPCGNPILGSGGRCRRCDALQMLELGANATESEIKTQYHILVKVWHPDRFQKDKPMKDAAEAKLKNVNSAYMFLSSEASKPEPWQPPWTTPEGAAAPRPAASASSASARRKPTARQRSTRRPGSTAGRSGRRMGALGFSPSLFSALKFVSVILLAAFALLITRYLWIAFDVQGSSSGFADALGGRKPTVGWSLSVAKGRFLAAVEQDLERLDPRNPSPEVAPQAAEVSSAVANSQTMQTPTRQQPAKTKAAPLKLYSYITVGSTKDEVIAQQGPPTASSEDKLVFGSSELYLKDGTVVGWKIDPRSPIKVKLWPASSVDPGLDHFSIGSSKDAVLVVQGTPTAFTQDEFEYGGSRVYFQNNRVVNWKDDPASIPLRARFN